VIFQYVKEIRVYRTLCRILISIAYGLTAFLAQAGEIYLAPGDSRVIKVEDNIDTVFISSPDIADYELIGDKSVVAYANSEGRADLIAFDKNGEQVLKTTLVVDSVLSGVFNQINLEFPDSKVNIQKMGKTYIISGTAPTEDAKDRIYQIVGEGIGAESVINKKEVSTLDSSSGSNSNENRSSWLDETIYRGVINKLELPITNQVNVKLSVVEVSREFTDNVGIDWSTIGASTGTFHFIKFNADSLTTLVHAISNESVARVLAEPNLSVLSGETAEFLVGGEVPVVTSSQNGTNVDYKEFGIKLNIGAKVSNSKKIRLALGEEVSNLDKTYSSKAGDSFPALQVRRAKTTVELADGESFLLGGLISNNEREALANVPFIGDVPILGALFRNASTERQRRELMVVATVNLVKPVSTREVILPDFNRTSTWARFFNLDGINERRDRQRAQEFIENGGFIK